MTDREQIIVDGVDVSKCVHLDRYFLPNSNEEFKDCALSELYYGEFEHSCKDNSHCDYKQLQRSIARIKDLEERIINHSKTVEEYCSRLANKEKECEELNNRMAEVIYRATGGRLSYSNYTLDAIEKAFNDQLEILSDQKVEEETKELNQKLYLAQNEIRSKTEYIQEQRDIIKKLEQECEHYHNALEEIEEAIATYSSKHQYSIANDLYNQILDIINKAKE